MQLFHVLFDGEPTIITHVCANHRAVADLFECDQDHGDGECDHVQYQPCDCVGHVECVVGQHPVTVLG